MAEYSETFAEWLEELCMIFQEKYGYTQAEAEAYTSVPDDWRCYFDDGHSPSEAAHEDMLSAGESISV